MKQLYRISILVLLFCISASAAFATGHLVNLSGTNVTCFGSCNGSATSTVTGGTGPFTYLWMPGSVTTANMTNMCAGTYTLVVTDMADASTTSATITITQPPQLALTIGSVQPAMCGNNNGSATVIVSGGVGAYSYSWAPCCGFGSMITNVGPGSYTCTVTDANACTASVVVTIVNMPGPNAPTIAVSPTAICVGQTAQLTTTVTGGTAPFTYNWTNPNSSLNNPNIPSPVSSPAFSTTYTLTVTDANGCAVFGTATVMVNQAVAGTVSSTDATCNQSNGSMTVNVTQAANPYSILWSNSQTTATINNLTAGVYSVTITDANGCTLGIAQGLNNVGGPTVNTSSTNTGCTNSSTGTATANASGVAPFTYQWNTVPAQTSATATGLGAGNYLVTVTDAIGCVSVSSAPVNSVAGNLYMYAYWYTPSNCSQPTGSINSVVQGGTAPYDYLWSNGDTMSQLTNVLSGSYTLTVTDVNGCSSSGAALIPSLCANYVQGRVYYDVNQDNIFNAGDYPLQGVLVGASPLSLYSVTDANGLYWRSINLSGTYDLSIASTLYYQNETPVSGHRLVTFSGMGDTLLNEDFALMTTAPFQDLYVSLASGLARPGWSQMYSIHAENRGTTTVSDTIWFHHDSILSLINAYPPFDGYTYPDGYWLFNNFAPGNTISKTVYLQVPTIPNGGYIGRNLFASAGIEPTSTDTTPTDNGDDEHDIITGSYDPNLKESWSPTMNSSGDIWPADLTLDYTIHFQNSGNDTAFTVVVVDTLPAELDITTFRMGASSHPCSYSINGYNDTNIVTFTFMNILLPDSNINEAASHGYVQFTIDRYPNLPIGTTIGNEANNYFDFNPGIVTNLNVVTVSNPLAVIEQEEMNIHLYPNPAQNNVNVVLGSEYSGKDAVVILRDISGREIARVNSNGSTMVNFNLEECSAGVYFISVECGETETVTQKMIISAK